MSTTAPITAGDRILSLDVLRGFALLGILIMTIWCMHARATLSSVSRRRVTGYQEK